MPGYIPETWNPIIGCNRVSDGCTNCYALRMAKRAAGMEKKRGVADYRLVLMPGKDDKPTDWNGHTVARIELLDVPDTWKRPRAVFVCSMGDLFHQSVDLLVLDAIFSVITDNKRHLFILLTKRPQVALAYFESRGLKYKRLLEQGFEKEYNEMVSPPNLWLGVTAENQEMANERIPILMSIPAAKRFVSIEPMLGPVDLECVLWKRGDCNFLLDSLEGSLFQKGDTNALDWVIVGGETGPKARPVHPDWERRIQMDCEGEKVPFFFKQWGSNEATGLDGDRVDGCQYHEWPEIEQ